MPLQAERMAEMLFAATQELFTSMLGTEVRLVAAPEEEPHDPFDGILSLIGFTGKVIGNGEIICTAGTACDLSSRFLMAEFQHVDEQVLDAVGEITNMIVGGFKNRLEAHVGRLQMSIPTVVHGKNISARNLKADVAVTLLCAYADGEIQLKLGLAASRD
ncbi:MAG TPA: chemotaxis protein CheX [Bryobacteraceae bacterium]|nr:chemotaxis protein CheX [Bryobacteraceae bacterium]